MNLLCVPVPTFLVLVKVPSEQNRLLESLVKGRESPDFVV